MGYLYRKESGEIVEVDFETMMGQQGGMITLPDGSLARRCLHLEAERDRKRPPPPKETPAPGERPHISDALSFNDYDLEETRAEVNAAGFGSTIEFVPDPTYPRRYQMKFPNHREFLRYAKTRGLADNNSRGGGGAMLSQELLDRAAELVGRQ